jgi:Gram-negative bacterial TonB protein C-terminal
MLKAVHRCLCRCRRSINQGSSALRVVYIREAMLARNFTFILTAFVVLQLNAQVDSVVVIRTRPNGDPQFPGGDLALRLYLEQNPIQSADTTCIGKLWVEFTVDSNGYVVDPRIAKGLCISANEEAIRLVRKMPQWEPGSILGRRVPVKYQLGITVGEKGTHNPNPDQVVPVDCSTVTDSNHVFMSWQVDEPPELIPAKGTLAHACPPLSEYSAHSDCTGTVYMTFIIERTGEVTEPNIKRGLCKDKDAAALEAAKEMPPWKPGRCNGIPVRVQMLQTVYFALE